LGSRKTFDIIMTEDIAASSEGRRLTVRVIEAPLIITIPIVIASERTQMRCLRWMLLADLTKDVVVLALSGGWGWGMEIRCFRLAEVRRVSGRGLGGCVLRLRSGVLGGIEMGGKTMMGILVSRYLMLRQECLLLVLREGRMDGGLRVLLRKGRRG
jgi:hypothetical protein